MYRSSCGLTLPLEMLWRRFRWSNEQPQFLKTEEVLYSNGVSGLLETTEHDFVGFGVGYEVVLRSFLMAV